MVQLDWVPGTGREGWSKLPNWAVDALDDMSGAATRVYLRLVRVNRADERNRVGAWASTATLAEWTGLNARTVRRAVDELLAGGLITVRTEGVRGKATEYFIVQRRPRKIRGSVDPRNGTKPTEIRGSVDPPTKTARSARSRVKFTGTSG